MDTLILHKTQGVCMYVQQAIALLESQRETITNTANQVKHLGYLQREIDALKKLPDDSTTVDQIIPVIRNNRSEEQVKNSTFCQLYILPVETTLRKAEKQHAEDAEKLRLETEAAERLRLETEAAEKLRLETEAAEKLRLETEAAEKLRLETEAAEKLRLETEAAEQLRLETEAAEKLRLETEAAKQLRLETEAAEQLRLETEAAERLANEKPDADVLPVDYAAKLNSLKPSLDEKVQPHLEKLLIDVAKLSEKDAAAKAEILEKTHALLTAALTDKEYQDFARTVQGRPSPALKAIGIIMLALAGVVLALGLGAPALGVGIGIKLGLEATLAASAGFAGAGGLSIFASRQRGLSKDMEQLAESQHTVAP